MFEVEQKFRVEDFTAIEAKLRELGAKFHEPIEQADSYFAHPARNFRDSDEALRIRQVGEQNFITYKGPKVDTTTKTRREIELPLDDGSAGAEQFSELLQALSFTPVAVVRKVRRGATLTFQDWNVEVAMDRFEPIGNFVEIELAAEEPQLDDARGCLFALAEVLGLVDVERKSYLAMLLATRP